MHSNRQVESNKISPTTIYDLPAEIITTIIMMIPELKSIINMRQVSKIHKEYVDDLITNPKTFLEILKNLSGHQAIAFWNHYKEKMLPKLLSSCEPKHIVLTISKLNRVIAMDFVEAYREKKGESFSFNVDDHLKKYVILQKGWRSITETFCRTVIHYKQNKMSSYEMLCAALTTNHIKLLNATRLEQAINEVKKECEDNQDMQACLAGLELILLFISKEFSKKNRNHYYKEKSVGGDLSLDPLGAIGFEVFDIESIPKTFINLAGIFLCGFDIPGADLQGVNLEKAIIASCNLDRVNLLRANLKDASIERCLIDDTNFQNTDLQNAIIDIHWTKFKSSNFKNAYFNGTKIDPFVAYLMSLDGFGLEGTNIPLIYYDQSKLRNLAYPDVLAYRDRIANAAVDCAMQDAKSGSFFVAIKIINELLGWEMFQSDKENVVATTSNNNNALFQPATTDIKKCRSLLLQTLKEIEHEELLSRLKISRP